MKKRALAAILSLVFVIALLAACAPASDTGPGPEAPGGTAPAAPAAPTPPAEVVPEVALEPEAGANLADHIDIIVDMTTITIVNPTESAGGGAPTSWAYNLVHDKLFEIVGPGEYVPGLATRWETDDWQHFRFYLRDNAYFHNGDPFTAEDVAFTVEVAQRYPAGHASGRWRQVETVTIVEPHIVELVLSDVNVDFLFDVSHWSAGILNRRAYEERPGDPMWASVGTGPFRVVDFASGNFLTVERFDDYWGEAPLTRSLTFWTIPEMAARPVMLSNGEAQIAFAMSPEDLDMMEGNPDFQIITDVIHFPVILGFNNQGDAIMMCPYFRKAVAHAINPDDIAVVAQGNWGIPAWDGNIWSARTQFRADSANFPRREQNLVLAMEYLERSVYNGEPIEIMTATAAPIRASEIVQIQLQAVGIDAFVEQLDHPSFSAAHLYDPESTRQIHVFSIGGSPSALGSARASMYPGIGTNRLNLNNDHLTGLIDALAAEPDTASQEVIAHQIQQFLYDDISALPLYWNLSGIPAVQGLGGLHLWGDPFRYSLRGIFWDLEQTPEHLRP